MAAYLRNIERMSAAAARRLGERRRGRAACDGSIFQRDENGASASSVGGDAFSIRSRQRPNETWRRHRHRNSGWLATNKIMAHGRDGARKAAALVTVARLASAWRAMTAACGGLAALWRWRAKKIWRVSALITERNVKRLTAYIKAEGTYVYHDCKRTHQQETEGCRLQRAGREERLHRRALAAELSMHSNMPLEKK